MVVQTSGKLARPGRNGWGRVRNASISSNSIVCDASRTRLPPILLEVRRGSKSAKLSKHRLPGGATSGLARRVCEAQAVLIFPGACIQWA
eukprot:gene7942-biopygen50